jgi:putative transposase
MERELIYKRVERYDIPGHVHFLTFSCHQRLPLLTNDVWRGWLGEAVRNACDALEVALWAYVFMPEHVHLMVHPGREGYRISQFLYHVKRPFALRVVGRLKEDHSPLLRQLRVVEGGRGMLRFWQRGGGHDLNLWTMKKVVEKARYCHCNAVKRKLVKQPEQWRWSSFRWLELGRRENEPLRVDDWIDAVRAGAAREESRGTR